MQVGTRLDGRSLARVPEAARDAEELGYDFISSSETSHNPFLPMVLASEHTERIALQTSIALAFSRSPMDIAYTTWDLQAQSNGRFVLGLGSQVRGHIVRRFSMPWAAPARRMLEYIRALRAIWACWQHSTRLEFQGDYYSFNLMPPFFDPGPIEHPDVKVYLAAVNPRMLRVAGEVSDGVLLHSFSTLKYIREVVLPNLAVGAAKSGRKVEDLDIGGGGFIVTGATEEEIEASKRAAKDRIALYASTRSYASVMGAHGWDDTAERLYRMSVEGDWSKMGAEITDEMLEAFAVIGSYDDIVERVKARYGAYATAIDFSIPVRTPEDRERLAVMITKLHSVRIC